ncbi:MAG: GNAT family N-acetyltransferase [Lachnospiraceae bacterium]|nr:GNAT family N-acetyltransferase [Lachnospiraceae bacterium]
MIIRRSNLSDQPEIERLLTQVCKVHADIRPDLFIEGKRKYTETELAAIIKDDGRPVFAAIDDDGTFMGYCFTVIEEHNGFNEPPHKTLYIDDLCVDENIRGKHVGRTLYEYVREWAKSNGFYNITLHVWEHNEKAKSFYNAMGMKIQLYGMEEVIDS